MIFSETTSKRSKGFTLIELLVVISIISLLSTIILASVSAARARARDAVRLSDLHQLQIALEMYRIDNGAYPMVAGDSVDYHPFRAGLAGCFDVPGDPVGYLYGSTGYIQGIVSKYISKLPEDPAVSAANSKCYAYASDGKDYMMMALNSEVYNPPANLWRWQGNDLLTIAIFTPGAKDW